MAKEIAVVVFTEEAGQQTLEIVNRRWHGYRCRPNEKISGIKDKFVGVILVGADKYVDSLEFNPDFWKLDVPFLGIGYGHLLMAEHYGGSVKRNNKSCSPGPETLQLNEMAANSPLFEGIPDRFIIWMDRRRRVITPGDGFYSLGEAKKTPCLALQSNQMRMSVGFHPESPVENNLYGPKIIDNFCNFCFN